MELPQPNKKKPVYAPIPPEVERVGSIVLDSAFKVHTALGPGLLESAYRKCTVFEIRQNGLVVGTEVEMPVMYSHFKVETGYKIDILVENCVIAEVKATDGLHPIHKAQLLTYMRLSGVRLGYLINFNVVQLKYGIKRMVI